LKPLSSRVTIGLLLIAAAILLVVVVRTLNRAGTTQLGADALATSSAAYVSGPRSLSTESNGKGDVADRSDIVRQSDLNASSVSSLEWRSALSSRRTGWYLKQFAVSASPDDWYRAVVLAAYCAGTVAVSAADISKALKEENTSEKLGKSILSLHATAQEGCLDGDSEWSPPPMLNGLIKRARDSGSELALAPVLSEKTSKDGLTEIQINALKRSLSNESTRSAWVAMNSVELGQALRSTAKFAAFNSAEAQAIVFQSLCLSGDDCGSDSLYRGLLCNVTGYKICGTDSVGGSISDSFGVDRAKRISSLAADLRAAMNEGNLSAIGLVK